MAHLLLGEHAEVKAWSRWKGSRCCKRGCNKRGKRTLANADKRRHRALCKFWKCKVLIFLRVWSFDAHALYILPADYLVASLEICRIAENRRRTNCTEHVSKKIRPSKRLELDILQKSVPKHRQKCAQTRDQRAENGALDPWSLSLRLWGAPIFSPEGPNPLFWRVSERFEAKIWGAPNAGPTTTDPTPHFRPSQTNAKQRKIKELHPLLRTPFCGSPKGTLAVVSWSEGSIHHVMRSL